MPGLYRGLAALCRKDLSNCDLQIELSSYEVKLMRSTSNRFALREQDTHFSLPIWSEPKKFFLSVIEQV